MGAQRRDVLRLILGKEAGLYFGVGIGNRGGSASHPVDSWDALRDQCDGPADFCGSGFAADGRRAFGVLCAGATRDAGGSPGGASIRMN